MPKRLRPHLLLVVLAAFLCLLLPAAARAGTVEGPWVEVHEARLRLVAATLATASGKERLVAGVHVMLAPGWKTYWRTPGDSGGMPPELDWDQSQNVARARLIFPAPHRFADAMGTSIGYKDEVLFPIEIERKAAGAPIVLDVGLVLGICKDICVPVEAELKLTIPADGSSNSGVAALVERFDAQVPRAAGGSPGEPRLERLERRKGDDGKTELVAHVRFAEGASGTDLFVEAADDAYIPVPVRDGEEAGLARFRIPLASADKGAASPGKTLILTMVSSLGNAEARVIAR